MKKILFMLLIIYGSMFLLDSAEYQQYEIKSGETIWRVSKKFNISVDELCKINNISDVTKVKAGYSLKIPKNNNYSSKTEYKIHILKKNETLWRVSKRYGISVDDIKKINKIKDITKIKYGTKLKIPVNIVYLDYKLPINGEVKPFITSHFRGIHIFTDSKKEVRYVKSIDGGQISYIDSIPGFGLTVFIRHPNGLVATYSGFSEIYVKENMIVNKNQTIGLAGTLSRYNKYGILISVQYNGRGLKFDTKKMKFVKSSI